MFGFDDDLFAVLHLMIAGRLRWREPGAAVPGRIGLAAFDVPEGTLVLADRVLSRLLRKDWSRTLEDLERRRPPRHAGDS